MFWPAMGGWLHVPGVKMQYWCWMAVLGQNDAGHVLGGMKKLGSLEPDQTEPSQKPGPSC